MQPEQITFDTLSHRYNEPIAQFLIGEIAKTGEKPLDSSPHSPDVSEADAPSDWQVTPEPIMALIGEIALLEQVFNKAKPSTYSKRYQQIAARLGVLEKLVQTTPGHSLTAIIWKVSKLVEYVRDDQDAASEPLLKLTEIILDDLIRLACVDSF